MGDGCIPETDQVTGNPSVIMGIVRLLGPEELEVAVEGANGLGALLSDSR